MIFDCKSDINLEDLKDISPALLILFTHTALYCQEYNLPFVVTSVKSDREGVREISTTHKDGRALDFSVKGWASNHVYRFVYLTNKYFADIGAISYSDNQPRAAVYHEYEGQGEHIHLQVRPSAKVNRFVTFN